MREEIIKILIENWNGSYNDCADDLLDLFIVSKRFYLTYQDENDKTQKIKVFAINDDEALSQLKRICPKATYIFINTL